MEELQRLKNCKGSGTSIVTLMIPSRMKPHQVTSHLDSEIGTASNIKDKGNRKSVIDALKTSISFLRSVKSIPSTGMAIYAGWYL